MSQLSPAAEPFSNLAGSVLIGAALSETTSHFACVVECFFKMRDYQVEHDLEAVETEYQRQFPRCLPEGSQADSGPDWVAGPWKDSIRSHSG